MGGGEREGVRERESDKEREGGRETSGVSRKENQDIRRYLKYTAGFAVLANG